MIILVHTIGVQRYSSCNIQQNFSGSKTDGLFTMAVSNLFLSALKKIT